MNQTANDILEAVRSKVSNNTVFLSEDGSPTEVKYFISTGSSLLDYCISNRRDGGIPVGKITSISGMPQTGKTLLATQICANAQKKGGLAIYIDSENALNFDFAERVGLDTKNNFLYMNPSSLEDVFNIMYTTFGKLHEMEKNKENEYPFVVMVWDSVAASVPKKELSKEEVEIGQIGIKANLLSTMIPKILGQLGRRRVAQVFLNQLRTNIQTAQMGGFGPKDTEPGGNAIPFYSSARIKLKYLGKVKALDETIGTKAKAEVPKTRFGPSFRECEFNIYFTKGVDDKESIVHYLVKRKKVDSRNAGRKGKVYKFGDNEYTLTEYKQKLAKDPKFRKMIEDLLEETMVKDLIDPDKEIVVLDKEQG